MDCSKILYIYGHGSDPKTSSTMKIVSEVVKDLGFELVSVEYDQLNPDDGVTSLEKYIDKNDIKYVIGHSLGGFITLCLNSDVKKIVINPCMDPCLELPKLGDFSKKTLYDYEYLMNWLKSGDDTPWINQVDSVMGLFGDKDELFSYYDSFKKRYPKAYKFNATHRPTLASFDNDIKTKIREFFK